MDKLKGKYWEYQLLCGNIMMLLININFYGISTKYINTKIL